jgi:hypothetical protein
MMTAELIGAAVIVLPAIFIAYLAFFWRRRPIFWFIVALTLVGTGYLFSTGALHNIGVALIGDAEIIEEGR